jgi:hypothetical protein
MLPFADVVVPLPVELLQAARVKAVAVATAASVARRILRDIMYSSMSGDLAGKAMFRPR